MDSINKTGSSTLRGALGRPRLFFSPLRIAAIVIALGVLAPLVSLLWLAASAGIGHWDHLMRYVLP
ncbi:iron ABC transporter permease, partial [Pectobacterium parmentieri]